MNQEGGADTHADSDRLQGLFGKPELARLVDRLQARFERAIDSPFLTLPDPPLNERKAIASLLGRPVGSGRSLRINIADLDAIVRRAGLAPDLRTAVECLRGPLRNLADEKAKAQRTWQAVFDTAKTEARRLDIDSWLEQLQRGGLLKRLAKGDADTAATLLQQAMNVIRQLPGRGQTLSTLAANALGDAHALDAGRPVATLVKRALRQIGQGDEGNADDRNPGNRDRRQEESERELWADAGILPGGAITSTVLALNLPVSGDSCTDHIIQQARQQGQPLWLTLRQLVRNPAQWQVSRQTVYICENPAVVAEAADQLGADCAPLVCTCGQPRAAVNHLLKQLQQAGAELAYHGDFDWPGITIANNIIRRFGAKPWHFDEAAYRHAAATGKMTLTGKAVTAAWDPGLSAAMKAKNTAIPEERVLERLLGSLQPGTRG